MNSQAIQSPFLSNYSKATLWLAIITIIVIPPFSIANLMKGHFILAFICFSFMVLLVLQCALIRSSRYSVAFTLLALVPAITLYIFFQIYTHGIVGVFWSFPASMVLYFILPLNHAVKASIGLLAVNIPLVFIKLDVYHALVISLSLTLLAIFSGFILSIIEHQQRSLHQITLAKRDQIDRISSQLEPSIEAMREEIRELGNTTNPQDQLLALSLKTKEISQVIGRI